MREIPGNRTPPHLLREGDAASESSQIYDLSKVLACTPLKWWFSMTTQSGFPGTQRVSVYIGWDSKSMS